MRRATAVLAAGSFTVLLSACGTNNITDSYITPAATAPVQTATASIATATVIPATATTTAAPPVATLTSTPSATPTPTATAQAQAAMVLFSADPMNAAHPFPSDRLLDAEGHSVDTSTS